MWENVGFQHKPMTGISTSAISQIYLCTARVSSYQSKFMISLFGFSVDPYIGASLSQQGKRSLVLAF